MTEKTLDWLNQNRFRAYPYVNDEGLLSNGIRIPDCILLDCLIMDTRHDIGIPTLKFTRYEVTDSYTKVYFSYSGVSTSYTIADHGSSSSSIDDSTDDPTIVKITGKMIDSLPSQFVQLSMTFSSHGYILEKIGKGTWDFTGTVLPSKIVSVTASGVSGVHTNGSLHVQSEGTATGEVHLKDGYRTQPVIQNGKIKVKVGDRFGLDPCHYPRDTSLETSCDDLLLFFCGQNAINSGNVVISGGPGVGINQGGTYEAKEDIIDTYGNIGISKGEKVPCVEIVASSELLRIYRPTATGSSSESSS